MGIVKAVVAFLVLLAFGLINVRPSFPQDNQMLEEMAADDELQQEMKWLKAETYVFTPSKVMEDVRKSTASVTVVTDRQIRQMGARDLADVLDRAVPGLSIYYYYTGARSISVRGSSGYGSKDVLLMINSHPMNNVDLGGSSHYDDLIIDNIKRIEVIRGPGSALYGTNAFHGVINVITKEAEDIEGLELIARGGSYDTQQYNLLFGKTLSDLEVTFNFDFFKTHGFRGPIEEDFQTQIDRLMGLLRFPPASLAPGYMKGDLEKYDGALNLKYKGFEFDGRYVDQEWDVPVGWFAALNNKSLWSLQDYYLTLSYETTIREGLDFCGKVYRNQQEIYAELQILPPEVVWLTPRGFATWPNGVIQVRSKKSSRTGVEIQATYNISDANTLVAGATYEDQKWYDHSSGANYLPTSNPYLGLKLPSVQKWPEELTAETKKRSLTAAFIEDIWDVTDELRLTAGARYDHYSDFGGHLSPRVGITWEYIKGYDVKLLYGHAFRAPSFEELHNRVYGNPDLGPETTNTYEISFGAEFAYDFTGRLTLYHREAEDLIVFTSTLVGSNESAINQGRARDQGLELEMKYDFGKGTYLAGNYNYSNWKTGSYATAQRHEGKIMTNIRLSRYLNLYGDCRFLSGKERWDPKDTRDDPSGYGIVNATLIAKRFLKRYEELELRGSVYNLFDKDWTMPQPPVLPNDLPMPGINFLLEIRCAF